MSIVPRNVKYKGKIIKFSKTEIEIMNELGITKTTVISRIEKGWPKFFIVNQPKLMSREDFECVLKMKRIAERNRKKRLEKKRELILKEQKTKAHLFKYPQKIKPSKYYYNLLEFATKIFN